MSSPAERRRNLVIKLHKQTQDLMDKLDNLSQPIHRYLLEEECKGEPNRNQSCPVWHYVFRHLHGQVPEELGRLEVKADPLYITVKIAHEVDPVYEMVRVPNRVRDFIEEFDRRTYPELIEEE